MCEWYTTPNLPTTLHVLGLIITSQIVLYIIPYSATTQVCRPIGPRSSESATASVLVHCSTIFRSPFLQNMGFRYGFRGVFPVGVRPDLPQTVTPTGCPPDPVGGLTSGDRLVDSKGFHQVHLSQTPTTRDTGNTVAESLTGCCSMRKLLAGRTVG